MFVNLSYPLARLQNGYRLLHRRHPRLDAHEARRGAASGEQEFAQFVVVVRLRPDDEQHGSEQDDGQEGEAQVEAGHY
ncbi:MAG: hypothetical protein IT321_21700 [Anaerolineae bacterium]|nr:hypothetical protein [Anaerolineae bacterium]